MYTIHMGIPEMKEFWNTLQMKVKSGQANKDEQRLYKRFGKAMKLLSENPRHPGLQSHEITALTARFGRKVWESYLENNTPGAEHKKITISQMGEEVKPDYVPE